MRIVFFGTPAYAVPTLERLVGGPHDVVAVVSQPDRPRGRGRARLPSPVAARALELGIPLLRPERVGDAEVAESLRRCEPDIGVVVAFGQFLPRRIRELPSLGLLINAHASLLPRYRGAAPINHALLAGERVTGVSVMRVDREMDAGPILLARSLEIAADENAGELSRRMAALSADVIAEALERIADGRAEWTAQDASQATFAPKIEAADTWIDWCEPAEQIARRVRALAPSPGARTTCQGETLRILASHAEPGASGCTPGTARRDREGALRVSTVDGWLVVRRLQRAGGKPLDVADYLRGRSIPDGTCLGREGAKATRC
ncbi:MAG TPA: methionyl-tRNA formyltransferase [Myxococcota bacterium]